MEVVELKDVKDAELQQIQVIKKAKCANSPQSSIMLERIGTQGYLYSMGSQ